MDKIIREACVETQDEIDGASRGGADRIELCAHLEVGGLTPERSMVEYALAKNLSIAAMIRLHDGFYAAPDELALLAAQMRELEPMPITALVFGFLTKDKRLDIPALTYLLSQTQTKEKVFHMAFDEIAPSEQLSAIDALRELGFTRILTKGGAGKALDNLDRLTELAAYSQGKIELLCGGGVTDENYEEIARKTGIKQFHGRKLAVVMRH
jgi:copper homeostasis protein